MDLTEKLDKIDKLRKTIASCQRCQLHRTRTNTVPGEGDANAKIMFIGEAPGRNEDREGKPFVGRAGAIFDKLLTSIQLTREQIFLCNILKCRPPQNRNPLPEEIQACVGNLDIQIKVVNPTVIATLGNFATTYIFEKFKIPFKNITSVKGKIFDVDSPFGHKKVVPLYHPAVATYNSGKMDEMLRDFNIIKKFLN